MTDAPAAPELPEWCFEDDQEGVDDDGNALHHNGHGDSQDPGEGTSWSKSSNGDGGGGGAGRRRREMVKRNPQFMPGVPGVTAVTEQPTLQQIQRRVQDMVGWKK